MSLPTRQCGFWPQFKQSQASSISVSEIISPNDTLSTLFEMLELKSKMDGRYETHMLSFLDFQGDVKWFMFDFKNGPSLHFPSEFCYISLSKKGFLSSSLGNME